MKDPGPNAVELLKYILAATGPAAISSPGVAGLNPILYPAIFHDDCTGTEPYEVTGTGEGFQASYVTEAAFVGLNGLKIQTRETGAAIADLSTAKIWLPANALPIIRAQFLFARDPNTSTHFYTQLQLRADDESSMWVSQVEIGWQAPSISYWKKVNAAHSMTAIAGWLLQPAYHAWNHLQLAINVATACYHEIKFNGKTLSIPTEPLDATATINRGPLLELQLQTRCGAAEQANSHFDQILVTAEAAP